MINVCIAGPNSYIGGSVARRLEEFPESYRVFKLSVRDGKWKDANLSEYDVVIYAAGIVHSPKKRSGSDIYYLVNRDVTRDFAIACKEAGVGQFVFLSSMSVYGMNSGRITKPLAPSPNTDYGKSKLEAENILSDMSRESFAVAIVRPPLVYGRGCKGNYMRLRNLALKMPVFPLFSNKRSLVYIGNLVEAIKLIIDGRLSGTFFPQNAEYVDVGKLVADIAARHGKKLRLLRGFGWLLKLAGRTGGAFEKVFGDLTYDMDMSLEPKGYQIYDYEKSITLSEEEMPIEGR